MKVILATGIFPPDIGGPATYTRKLAESLVEEDVEVEVICYSDVEDHGDYGFPVFRILRTYPWGIRHFLYFLNLFKVSTSTDIIYAFNLTSSGFPAYLVSKILNKKFVIRIGGDFLWERAVRKKEVKHTIKEYYTSSKGLKERLLSFLIGGIMKGADRVVFTTNFQKDLYEHYFGLREEYMAVISNPFPDIKEIRKTPTKHSYQFLYAGRLIEVKNLEYLIEAFRDATDDTSLPVRLKLVGKGSSEKKLQRRVKKLNMQNRVVFEGVMDHETLLQEIKNSYACVLPSLSEISPNFALECVKINTPILLTKETGLYDVFEKDLIFIDPKNKKDIKEKILYLLDSDHYQKYLEKIKKINLNRGWTEVVKDHLYLFDKLCAT